MVVHDLIFLVVSDSRSGEHSEAAPHRNLIFLKPVLAFLKIDQLRSLRLAQLSQYDFHPCPAFTRSAPGSPHES